MFAIVFWLREERFSIIPLSAIPKKDRYENAVSKVTWKDGKSSEVLGCKVLKIEESVKELEKWDVGTDGKLIEPKARALTAEVQESKKKMQSLKKEKEVNVKATSQELDQKILDAKSLAFNKSRVSAVLEAKTRPQTANSRDSSSIMRNGQKINPAIKKSSKVSIRSVEIIKEPQQFDQYEKIDDEDDEIVDDASEDEGRSETESPNIFPPVTIEFARSVMQWAKFLEKHCAEEMKKNNSSEIFNHGGVPDEMRTPGPEKTEISPGSSVFIRTIILNDMKSRIGNQWRKFATELLLEIYGTNLKNRTAKGTRGTKGIDHSVFMAIFDCINHESEEYISLAEFTKLVTIACSNRRRASKRKGPVEKNERSSSSASGPSTQQKRTRLVEIPTGSSDASELTFIPPAGSYDPLHLRNEPRGTPKALDMVTLAPPKAGEQDVLHRNARASVNQQFNAKLIIHPEIESATYGGNRRPNIWAEKPEAPVAVMPYTLNRPTQPLASDAPVTSHSAIKASPIPPRVHSAQQRSSVPTLFREVITRASSGFGATRQPSAPDLSNLTTPTPAYYYAQSVPHMGRDSQDAECNHRQLTTHPEVESGTHERNLSPNASTKNLSAPVEVTPSILDRSTQPVASGAPITSNLAMQPSLIPPYIHSTQQRSPVSVSSTEFAATCQPSAPDLSNRSTPNSASHYAQSVPQIGGYSPDVAYNHRQVIPHPGAESGTCGRDLGPSTCARNPVVSVRVMPSTSNRPAHPVALDTPVTSHLAIQTSSTPPRVHSVEQRSSVPISTSKVIVHASSGLEVTGQPTVPNLLNITTPTPTHHYAQSTPHMGGFSQDPERIHQQVTATIHEIPSTRQSPSTILRHRYQQPLAPIRPSEVYGHAPSPHAHWIHL